jgi:hypothetical protein
VEDESGRNTYYKSIKSKIRLVQEESFTFTFLIWRSGKVRERGSLSENGRGR